MDTTTVMLPDEGLGYTAPAQEALASHGWSDLLGRTAQAMAGLPDGAIAWFCPLSTLDDSQTPHPVVGLVVTGADKTPDLSGSPLTSAGTQPLPEMAFPGLLVHKGQVHRIWLDDAEGPVCLYLHQDHAQAQVENLAVQTAQELLEIEHTTLPGICLDFDEPQVCASMTLSGHLPEELDGDAQHIERLKIAFVWQFVYMVIHADGEVHEQEVEFLQRLFPTDLLADLDLVDARGEFKEPDFTLAKTEALKVLPSALSVDDRVQILRTLQQAAWADGILLPEETRVFRMARQLLEVPRDALSC